MTTSQTTQKEHEISEIELVYRRKGKDKVQITQSQTAYELFKQSWDNNKMDLVEHFKIMLLRRNNACIGISHIATGGVASCIADPKIVFMTALRANASTIILAHNHPSGNLTPSQDDLNLTSQMVAAARLLDMKVVDHLILTSEGYLSFADDGLMP